MKKIIAAILTVSLLMSASTAVYAAPKGNQPKVTNKANEASNKADDKKKEDKPANNGNSTTAKKADNKKDGAAENKTDNKKDSALENNRSTLTKKCNEMIEQINKLKGYIVSAEGKFLVEFKDQATGDASLKSIDEALNILNSYKKQIEAASSSDALKEISKELQKNLTKHQNIIKRITGLTNAARLKAAYDETKALVDKLSAGVNGITGSGISLDVKALKKRVETMSQDLEKARNDYLDAVALFSTISDSSKDDKSFKEAQKKFDNAKKGLHDVLVEAKQLLVKIRTSINK